MEQEKSKNGVIALLVIIIVGLLVLVLLFATGTISFKSSIVNNSSNESSQVTDNNNQNDNTSNQENTNTKSLSEVCTEAVYDKLKILSTENKTEKVGAMGGSTKGYNVTTTVTKEHNYTSTPENDELYALGSHPDTVFVLYKNKLYYTGQDDIISKYCEIKEILIGSSIHSKKLTCDYSKFNDDSIKEFTVMNIDANLKAIGSYGNAGSASPTPYAITTDGKVITITKDSTNNYNGCGIMYDDSEYPIDRIFNMNFYDNTDYKILLKDGTLITRDVDREHLIEYEH